MDNLKTIVIGFSKPRKPMIGSSIIQKFDGDAPFSHVYLKVYTPYADRELVYQASHGYVNCITFWNFASGNKPVAEFAYEIREERHKEAVRYCMDRLGRPYSYIGLLKIAWKKLMGRVKNGDGEQSYVCSELAARALPEFFRGDSDYATPMDLYKSLTTSSAVRRLL